MLPVRVGVTGSLARSALGLEPVVKAIGPMVFPKTSLMYLPGFRHPPILAHAILLRSADSAIPELLYWKTLFSLFARFSK